MTRAGASTQVSPAATRESVVVIQNVSKVFKDFWRRDRARAVDGVSLEIRPREIFGLLGPNGSGKSTTIKMILGLLKPTAGRIAIFGRRPSDVSIKSRIGYLPEESYLYPFLNARETLDYYAKLFGLDERTRRRRIDELLDMIGLTGAQFRPVREYSKGMQRRLGIAQALINDPDLLILDEPTTGLDPLGTRQIKDLILQLGRRGKTILLCSHLLADVEDVVDRMVILYGGRIQAEGTCDELLTSRTRMSLETDTLDDDTIEAIDRLIRDRSGDRHSLRGVGHTRQRLEELFLEIVERARAAQVSTSGATAGGATAGFLRAEAAQGEALIDRLVAGEPEPRAATPAPKADPEPAPGADRAAIDALMDAYPPEEGPARRAPDASRAVPPAASPPAPPRQQVDKGFIEGLLDDDAKGTDS